MTPCVPDDIKIIAQFLARRSGEAVPWQELVREAYKLRRELKERGGYRISQDRTTERRGTHRSDPPLPALSSS